MGEPKRKLTKDERARLQLSRETLRYLKAWPEVREEYWRNIEAGGAFRWRAPGEPSRAAWKMLDDTYELAKANVERWG